MIKTAGDLAYLVGRRAVLPSRDILKRASDARPVYHLAGRLYLSGSGWLLMSVPNALARGAFDALDEPGIELPTRDTDDPNAKFNAHVSVMTAEEVESLGGGDKITERGHMYRYSLGPVKTVDPTTWNGVSRVWYITINSPELRQLRKSYGLSAQPNEDWDFHCTIGIRRTGVLHPNEKSKAAAHPLLPQLQQIKALSDQRNYAAKHQQLQALMQQQPEEWEVDQPKKHHPGVVHTPTHFQFHTDRHTIPPNVKKLAALLATLDEPG